jgi:surface protein
MIQALDPDSLTNALMAMDIKSFFRSCMASKGNEKFCEENPVLKQRLASHRLQIKISVMTDENIHECVLNWIEGREGIREKLLAIGDWNVSAVTDMSWLFSGSGSSITTHYRATRCSDNFKNFNEDITKWDISNVTNMDGMFFGASSFNQEIGEWNVSNVKSMGFMFATASSFDREIGEWNVSNVEYMSHMFDHATAFNRPLAKWFEEGPTKDSTAEMFLGATSFDQPVEKWDLSNVENVFYMFEGASSLKKPFRSWTALDLKATTEKDWVYVEDREKEGMPIQYRDLFYFD